MSDLRKPTSPEPRMLPGMAMISIFMLVISMASAFAAFATPMRVSARYATLLLCSAMVAGVFGFLRLRRWGWILVVAGTLFYALVNVVLYVQTRQLPRLFPAAFSLVFFLYLVRTEVRERLS